MPLAEEVVVGIAMRNGAGALLTSVGYYQP